MILSTWAYTNSQTLFSGTNFWSLFRGEVVIEGNTFEVRALYTGIFRHLGHKLKEVSKIYLGVNSSLTRACSEHHNWHGHVVHPSSNLAVGKSLAYLCTSEAIQGHISYLQMNQSLWSLRNILPGFHLIISREGYGWRLTWNWYCTDGIRVSSYWSQLWCLMLRILRQNMF